MRFRAMSAPHKIRSRSLKSKRPGKGNTLVDVALNDLNQNRVGGVDSVITLLSEVGAESFHEDIKREVEYKTGTLLVGRKDAKIESVADGLISKWGSAEEALLRVVATMENKSQLPFYVNMLINRGARTSVADSELKTPLHHAVSRNLKDIAAKLLENDAIPYLRDNNSHLPLTAAMEMKSDDMCALLIENMSHEFVRGLFLNDEEKDAEFSFHQLLETDMQRTILAVLDCMIDTDGFSDQVTAYYNILESDVMGRPPDHPDFDNKSKSPLQIIARQGNKTVIYHDVVRLLIRRKWKTFARMRYRLNALVYAIGLFCIIFSLITAVNTPDPTVYFQDDYISLQLARAIFECMSVLFVFVTFCKEMRQCVTHRLEYFYDVFNCIDLTACLLLLAVIPLRFTHQPAQWHVFAFGYLLWTVRIFKFAAVFRPTGIYTQILSRILFYDFSQFAVVFAVVLLAFSGSFFLSLRGDMDIETHSETSTFWRILFVGLRILTEGQPVVEYTGVDGYGKLSLIFMFCFLITCIVILLNILIAQLTDTYQKVQQDAQREVEAGRAWIVARVEWNSFICDHNWRKNKYEESEEIEDLKNVLTKWDSPPLNEMNKNIQDIWDSLESNKMNLLAIKQRMARQEHTLKQIEERLSNLTSLSPGSPDSFSDDENTPVGRPLYRVRRSNVKHSV